ncbi:MAG: CBS domain-containing protein [Myxococcales bacterium]|nr:CBS domain-containing protein [Myxococcales bacterium]
MVFTRIPRVKGVMTPFPYHLDGGDSLESATAMMESHGIRHVPVTEHGRVIGVISESDLRVASALAAERGEQSPLKLGVICTKDPYLVDLETRLDRVVSEMAGRQVGSALVMREDKLVGILTTTDACRLLGELLRESLPAGGDDDAA